MPKRDRAEYMRAYRAGRRGTDERRTDSQAIRIAELEAEVARLKRELAARPEQRKAAQAQRDAVLRAIQRGSA